MRQQYHSRQTENGRFIWDVHSLIEQSKHLPVQNVPLNSIAEMHENYWYDSKDGNTPTPAHITDHIALVNKADLSYPIILCADHRLMDGMHRCVKAMLENHETIKAVKFTKTPKPDYIDVPLDELPYDEKEK